MPAKRKIPGNNNELSSSYVKAHSLSWLNKTPLEGQTVYAKVRYRQNGVKGVVKKIDSNEIKIIFETPERAIAKGQALVLYSQEDELLGGGIIR